jgi:glycosyltransferase involved in cell wall biosynthesis
MISIRLGVIFDQKKSFGGGYQQAINAALIAKELNSNKTEVLFFTTFKESQDDLTKYGINAILIRMSYINKCNLFLRRKIKNQKIIRLIKCIQKNNPFEKILINRKIDLIYFLAPSNLAKDLETLNYITTVWDLCHRDNPEFPEVRTNREFELREFSYIEILSKATAIMVDSKVGKKNIIRRYAIDPERIFVMPFEAAKHLRDKINKKIIFNDINKKYNLKVKYIFYPAQFWPHKNHIYILEGIKKLDLNYNKNIGAIFSGRDFGNLSYLKEYADKLGILNRIRFIGFIKDEELIDLYQQSIALVMPTYFGPTNLPPLEAFGMGVPVLYSDRAGMREQVGDAALLMDLKEPLSMAAHIEKLTSDKKFLEDTVEKGKKLYKEIEKIDRVQILERIVLDFYWKRICWK